MITGAEAAITGISGEAPGANFPGCTSFESSPSLSSRTSRAAAVGTAFDLSEPTQSLLLDRRELPRTVGLAPADTLPDAVEAEMRRRASIKGVCQPPITASRKTVRCTAELPGYVIRFSPVFAMAADTVEVYLFAQNYDNASSGYSAPLRFERAYQVVRSGESWRAAREGRIPKEVRGDKR